MNSLAKGFPFALLLISVCAFASEIKDVKVSPSSFNPSIGQKIKISLSLPCKGLFKLEILDRDTYLITTLVQNETREGEQEFSWDGKTNAGEIVPDEAYSLRAVQKCGSKESVYFPANQNAKEVKVEFANYDPLSAMFRYTLPVASRVQVQAGAGPLDPKTGKPNGPVMKVPINREPRIAGKIAEQWNGMAEGESSIYIPDLPNFAFSILAIELPENTIITTGNRKLTFLKLASLRGTDHKAKNKNALDDVSPSLAATLPDARWNPQDRIWECSSSDFIRVAGSLEGEAAISFAKQSGPLETYIDQQSALKIEKPLSPFTFELPLKQIGSGDHILTLNWRSGFGMAAVNSMRIRINSSINNSAKRK